MKPCARCGGKMIMSPLGIPQCRECVKVAHKEARQEQRVGYRQVLEPGAYDRASLEADA